MNRLRYADEEIQKAKDDAARGNSSVGDGMRELREDAKVSLRAVARRLDLSAPYISDLELGRRGWTPELVARFVDAVGHEYLSDNVKVMAHPLAGANVDRGVEVKI